MATLRAAAEWPNPPRLGIGTGLIHRSVRECLETCLLQAQAGLVTAEALEGILARSSVLLRQLTA